MTTPPPDGQPDITLRDILTHIQGVSMSVRTLEGKVDRLEGKVDRLEGKVDRLETRLDAGLADLHERIDVLEADLTVTIKDTLVIRRHVGMSAGEDD